MNLMYCGDEHIRKGLLLSLMSITRYTRDVLNVYVLTLTLDTESHRCKPISDEVIRQAEGVLRQANPSSTITKYDMTEFFLKEIPTVNIDTRFTPCCMLRLFADEIRQIPDRILYLDTDVLARKDISELYNQDVSGYEFAGVLDYYGSWFFRRNPFRRDYCNSGVLLLNMAKIRETGLFKACRTRCITKKMFMPDQSALNKLVTCKKLLPRRYNDQRKLHKDTVLQHFTTSFRFLPYFHSVTVKPWDFDRVHSVLKLHEYDDLFSDFIERFESETNKN